jgi:hypothetical protein
MRDSALLCWREVSVRVVQRISLYARTSVRVRSSGSAHLPTPWRRRPSAWAGAGVSGAGVCAGPAHLRTSRGPAAQPPMRRSHVYGECARAAAERASHVHGGACRPCLAPPLRRRCSVGPGLGPCPSGVGKCGDGGAGRAGPAGACGVGRGWPNANHGARYGDGSSAAGAGRAGPPAAAFAGRWVGSGPWHAPRQRGTCSPAGVGLQAATCGDGHRVRGV